MTTGRTRPAGVARIDGQHFTAQPGLLVFQLAAELAPTLIENRLVEAGLGFHASPWRLNRTCCCFAHVGDFQIFDYDHRVAFADDVRGLVEKVIPGMSNPLMQFRDASFRLLPVVAEFNLTAHAPLILSQLGRFGTKGIDRLEYRTVRQRSKQCDASHTGNGDLICQPADPKTAAKAPG